MKYRFSDGKALEADSPEEFVSKMRNTSYSESEDVVDFMELCSERAEKLGVDIRFDNADNFLADLIYHGLVTPESTIPDWN